MTRAHALTGELTMATVPAILAGTRISFVAGETVDLDLSAADYADSAGVALLLELQRQAKAAGAVLRVRGAPPQLRRLAHFFKVEPLMTFL